MSKQLSRDEYTVGWICATPLELAAASELLDDEHAPLLQCRHDRNAYTLGRMGHYHVVIACLPAGRSGSVPAGTAVSEMKSTFGSLKFCLLVGVGSGITREGVDIRLGDVVVSQPEKQFGGVVQYDSGQRAIDGTFIRTGSLDAPPVFLLTVLQKIIARHQRGINKSKEYLDKLHSKDSRYRHPGRETDLLFLTTSHPQTIESMASLAGTTSRVDRRRQRGFMSRCFSCSEKCLARDIPTRLRVLDGAQLSRVEINQRP